MKGMFKDHTGKYSSMRLKTFMLVLVGCFIAIYQVVVFNKVDHFIVMEFITVGLGFKVWQNQQERNTKPGAK